MASSRVGSVVVVGGGVIGLAAALDVARLAGECTLVDPRPGEGASWAAAGMLSPVAEIAPGEEPLLAQLRSASQLWPAFARRLEETSGVDVGYTASSSILVGATASDVREIARSAAMMQQAGAVVELLGPEEAESLEPVLAGRVHGGYLLPEDARVDNRLVVEALLGAVKASGVRIVEDECVEVCTSEMRVRLELAHHGSLAADHCVVATGAGRLIPGMEDLGLPGVRPVRGTTLRLSASVGAALPTRTVRAVVRSTHCYLVPRCDGSLVVGATSEELGYDQVAPSGGIFRLLEAGREIYPGIDELIFEEASVGLRPATADHLPFVDRLADDRFIAALGHYRNGILLAPLAGARVAELLAAS